MNRFYFYITIYILFFACSGNVENELLSRFPKGAINHFPKTVDDSYLLKKTIHYPNDYSKSNMGAWYVAKYVNSPRLNEYIINRISEINPVIISNDCVLILPPRDYVTKEKGKPIISNCVSGENKTPIPSFIHELIEADSSRIVNDLSLFIIENNKGHFLHENILLEQENMLMIGWEHGLTKGIAIDSLKQEVYFWVELW